MDLGVVAVVEEDAAACNSMRSPVMDTAAQVGIFADEVCALGLCSRGKLTLRKESGRKGSMEKEVNIPRYKKSCSRYVQPRFRSDIDSIDGRSAPTCRNPSH